MVESNETGGLWPQLYSPFRGLGTRLSNWLRPASDASSDDRVYHITVELPGVSEDDIDLSVDNGFLTVSGEKTETREDRGDTWYFSERQYGAFRRSFRIPEDAIPEKADAVVKNGVLEISIPRRPAAKEQAKKIAIKKA